MRHEIPTVIVAQGGALRDALESNLRPPAFRIVTSRATLTDIPHEELPQSEPYLIAIVSSPDPCTVQIAELKQKNPLVRVVVVGQRWTPADIASAFEAGANAYFAEATVGEEFTQAMKLITR
jgi:DNA-binding NarL/FixJ family response regulator